LQRVLTTVTLLGLLVATAAAFVITEHLKLAKSPVFGVKVLIGGSPSQKLLSPVCGCTTSTASIRIKLRHTDHVTVTIVDSSHHEVRTVESDFPLRARHPHEFVWDGRTDAGVVAPDGVYHPWLHITHPRQWFQFTNKITVDTNPPEVHAKRVGRPHAFLAAPGRTVAIRYEFSEPAHALVYLGNRLITVGRRTRPRDKIKWAGTLGGRPLRAGTYVLSIGARDIAGNETPANGRKQVTVVLRYIQLVPDRITIRAGRRFTVHVDTAARRYTWRLGHRRGARRGRSLRLRAPTSPGSYRLTVAEHGHATTAVVRVRAK
jgi:FlgD Ig-like domain